MRHHLGLMRNKQPIKIRLGFFHSLQKSAVAEAPSDHRGLICTTFSSCTLQDVAASFTVRRCVWRKCCAPRGFFLCYKSDWMSVCVDSPETTDGRAGRQASASAVHAVGPRFNRGSAAEGRSDTCAVSDGEGCLRRSGLWSCDSLRLQRSKAASRWQKRLFEHWLNISQSYKKQRGGSSRPERRSPNQILCTAGTLLFFFLPGRLVDFALSHVPLPINCAGLVYKDISDPNANRDCNGDSENRLSGRTGRGTPRIALLPSFEEWKYRRVFYV